MRKSEQVEKCSSHVLGGMLVGTRLPKKVSAAGAIEEGEAGEGGA